MLGQVDLTFDPPWLGAVTIVKFANGVTAEGVSLVERCVASPPDAKHRRNWLSFPAVFGDWWAFAD
jgi:hypothetical protein